MIANMDNVFLIEYPLGNTRGFYHYFQKMNVIYIDERLPWHEKKFVCAHEMGHMILHKTCNAVFMDTRTQFNTSKFELDANRFAVEFLIPDEIILENIYMTTGQLSQMLGYQESFVELKLEVFREIH